MKRKVPKRRNLQARDLWTTGAFKQRVVPRKHKDPKHERRRLKEALRKDDPRE